MIELFFFPSPNGRKIAIFLEELGAPYKLHFLDMPEGEQFSREFLLISPNNKMPAIIDHEPAGGGEPISVFESGAILLYLAEKFGRFLPQDLRGKVQVTQWLMWQMSGLGPMGGQLGHFGHSAPEKLPYAIDRYRRENSRLYAVLDRRLQGRDFIADEYSIADMACYPWIAAHGHLGMSLEEFPNLKRWHDAIKIRPAVTRAWALLKEYALGDGGTKVVITDKFRRLYWGQSAETVRKAWAEAGL